MNLKKNICDEKSIDNIHCLNDLKKYSENKFIVIDAFAYWCDPCMAITSKYNDLANKFSNENIKFLKFNIDDNNDVVDSLEIKSIPLLIVLKNGKQVFRQNGLKSIDYLKTFMNFILNNECDKNNCSQCQNPHIVP